MILDYNGQPIKYGDDYIGAIFSDYERTYDTGSLGGVWAWDNNNDNKLYEINYNDDLEGYVYKLHVGDRISIKLTDDKAVMPIFRSITRAPGSNKIFTVYIRLCTKNIYGNIQQYSLNQKQYTWPTSISSNFSGLRIAKPSGITTQDWYLEVWFEVTPSSSSTAKYDAYFEMVISDDNYEALLPTKPFTKYYFLKNSANGKFAIMDNYADISEMRSFVLTNDGYIYRPRPMIDDNSGCTYAGNSRLLRIIANDNTQIKFNTTTDTMWAFLTHTSIFDVTSGSEVYINRLATFEPYASNVIDLKGGHEYLIGCDVSQAAPGAYNYPGFQITDINGNSQF